jgi:DnaJ-class molecular chaperone
MDEQPRKCDRCGGTGMIVWTDRKDGVRRTSTCPKCGGFGRS